MKNSSEKNTLAKSYSSGVVPAGFAESFDRITEMARYIFDVPFAFVSLVDEEMQWFKSRLGPSETETLQTACFCSRTLKTDQPFVVQDARHDNSFCHNELVTGKPHIRFYAGVPLGASRGRKNVGTLCLLDTRPRTLTDAEKDRLADLATWVMSELELRKLSIRDPLTNTLSRIEFRRALDVQIAGARATSRPFSMVMIGIDRLSWLNDTYGYEAGNLVLRDVAKRCDAIFRSPSIVARYSGKQFAVILPHMDLTQAVEAAEDLRAKIAKFPFEYNLKNIDATASIGVVEFSPRRDTSELIMARVSLRMEAAKRAGRNRVVHSDVLDETNSVA